MCLEVVPSLLCDNTRERESDVASRTSRLGLATRSSEVGKKEGVLRYRSVDRSVGL